MAHITSPSHRVTSSGYLLLQTGQFLDILAGGQLLELLNVVRLGLVELFLCTQRDQA